MTAHWLHCWPGPHAALPVSHLKQILFRHQDSNSLLVNSFSIGNAVGLKSLPIFLSHYFYTLAVNFSWKRDKPSVLKGQNFLLKLFYRIKPLNEKVLCLIVNKFINYKHILSLFSCCKIL